MERFKQKNKYLVLKKKAQTKVLQNFVEKRLEKT